MYLLYHFSKFIEQNKTSFVNFFFRLGDEGLTVHFNLHMDPSKGDISSNELVELLSAEMTSPNSTEGAETETTSILGDLSIDLQSINIQGK